MSASTVPLVYSCYDDVLPRRTTGGSSSEPVRWDTNIGDKLLFLVTPILLLISATLILFLVRPMNLSQKSIDCQFPRWFLPAMADYGRARCLEKNAMLYRTGTAHFSNETDQVSLADLFDPPAADNAYSTAVPTTLLLLAALCLVPFVCWRIVGSMEGREFLEESSFLNRHISLYLWFIFTKIGAVVVSTVIFMLVQRMAYSSLYDSVGSDTDIQSADVLCNFIVRRLGGNYHRYTILCKIYQSRNDGTSYLLNILFDFHHLVAPVLSSLLLWTICLLTATVVNAATTIILAAICTQKSFRMSFIQRNLGPQNPGTYEMADSKLGIAGVLVSSLAVKLGHGNEVRTALHQMCSKVH